MRLFDPSLISGIPQKHLNKDMLTFSLIISKITIIWGELSNSLLFKTLALELRHSSLGAHMKKANSSPALLQNISCTSYTEK